MPQARALASLVVLSNLKVLGPRSWGVHNSVVEQVRSGKLKPSGANPKTVTLPLLAWHSHGMNHIPGVCCDGLAEFLSIAQEFVDACFPDAMNDPWRNDLFCRRFAAM